MIRILSIALLGLLFGACGEQTTDSTQKTKTPEPKVQSAEYLPSLPMDALENLWTNCNQMDYIFYNLPISSSVSNNVSAQVHLKYISDTSVSTDMKNSCGKAIARIFYKTDGEDLIDAEVYFSTGCTFFVFYKDGKASYSNLMTPDGIAFFNQMITASNSATKGQ